LPPVPELQLQAIGIVIVRDRFQSNYCKDNVATSAGLKPSFSSLHLAQQRLVPHFGVMADVDSLHQE
jgi:uncharacterized membrane-anchored protein YhcB (DUF1043 family)